MELTTQGTVLPPLLVMYYDFAVLIETDDTVDSPKEQILELTKGVIHRVEVEFPAGCQGLVYLKLFHAEHQVWPTNPDGSYNVEDYTVPIGEHYKLSAEPYALKARGWGVGCRYDHTLTVRIGILPEDILLPLTWLGPMFKKFFKLLGVK